MRNYERRDVSPRAIYGIGAGLAISIVAILIAIQLWVHRLDPRDAEIRSQNSVRFQHVPGVELQVSPSADLQRLEAADREELHSYRWIDRRAGVVQIPIGRAMDLTAEKGDFR